MEKFNYPEHRDDILGWAFIAILAADKKEHKHNECIEIELKFDGVEYNFSTIIKRLKEEFDHQIAKEAKKLVKEKFGNLTDKIDNIEKLIEEIL